MQKRTISVFAVVVAGLVPLATGQAHSHPDFSLVLTIAFSGVHDSACLTQPPPGIAAGMQPSVAEIYLMSPDHSNVRRLTDNDNCSHFDNFASLSPDGKQIVFESNRLRSPGERPNTSDLFLMDPDGSNQTWLLRGSSASWSPALGYNSHGVVRSRQIVFHASASGQQGPIRIDPGAPTFDSDLFVVNIDDDCVAAANCRDLAHDITKDLQPDPNTAPSYNGGQTTPASPPAIEEDADWSPDGSKLVFTSHPAVSGFCDANLPCNDYPATEIYVVNADGTGLKQLTHNGVEERAAAWSPDGSRIVYMCRIGPLNAQRGVTFELCVMSADGDGDGTAYARLTVNPGLDASPSWSLDSREIVLHRNNPLPLQLWLLKADTVCANGVCDCPTKYANGQCETQLTGPDKPESDFLHGFPRWGVVRAHIPKA